MSGTRFATGSRYCARGASTTLGAAKHSSSAKLASHNVAERTSSAGLPSLRPPERPHIWPSVVDAVDGSSTGT